MWWQATVILVPLVEGGCDTLVLRALPHGSVKRVNAKDPVYQVFYEGACDCKEMLRSLEREAKKMGKYLHAILVYADGTIYWAWGDLEQAFQKEPPSELPAPVAVFHAHATCEQLFLVCRHAACHSLVVAPVWSSGLL